MEENKRKEHLNDCRTLKKKKDMKLALERFFSWRMLQDTVRTNQK
jgi:hypothetical protein